MATATASTILAETVEMEYLPAESALENGISPYHVSEDGWYRGRKVVNGGNGTYVLATPAHFILRVKVKGKEYEIWTERVFKNLLGIKRLTERRRQMISATMPEQVEVAEQESGRGKRYYTLSESSAESWAQRVRDLKP